MKNEEQNISIPEKVLKFEHFVNEDLRTKLSLAHSQREELYTNLAEYEQLKQVIKGIQFTNMEEQPLKTKVDLGCNFYIQAKVEDPSKIFVSIGYGFYLQFTLDEALAFIDKKTKLLNEDITKMTQQICQVRAHIKIVLEGIKELS